MKKIIISLLLMVLCVGIIFAQGSNEKAAVEAKDKPIELVYWSHYGQSPAFVQAFGDSIEQAAKNLGYSNVTCRAEVIEYSGYQTKYLTGFASDKGPDFFLGLAEDWAIDGGNNPIALPFSDKAEKAWNDSLCAGYYNDGIVNGKRYGFAAEAGGSMLMYINTDAMLEAGLDPEKDIPTTLDEMYDVAKKLTKKDSNNKIVRSGFQPRYMGGSNVWGKFTPYFHNFGARTLSEDLTKASGFVNSDVAIEAVTWYANLIKETTNLEFSAPETAFQSGQAAIITREAWFAQDVINKAPNINFKCVPFPAGKLNYSTTQGGTSWVNMISGKTKHPELCQELIAELAKSQYDVSLHEPASYPPVCKETLTLDNAYLGKQPYAAALIDVMNRKPAPVYGSNSAYPSVANILGDALASIMNGANIKTTLDSAAKQCDEIIAQNK